MKKLLTMLLIVTTVFSCLALLVSCGDTYTVKFSANGGSFDGGKSEIKVEADADSLLEKPDEPTRNGYRFDGWSTKEDDKDLWDFKNDKVTGDMTLYAVWTSTGSGNTPSGNTPGGSVETEAYSVKLTTKGGMPMSDITVYIWADDSIVTSAKTTAEGVADFALEKGLDYTVKVKVPDGYNAKSSYEFEDKKLELVLESSLLPSDYLDEEPAMELGDVMYDFSVTRTDGTVFTLSEALKENDAVVLNFWYDGCTWCEREFPVMQNVYLNYGEKDGNGKYKDDIALIALSDRDDMRAVQNYKSLMGIEIDMAPDVGAKITQSFNIGVSGGYGHPTTVVIDRYGVITLIEVGALIEDRPWQIMFDHFRGDDYKQQLIPVLSAIIPVQKPADEGFFMPSSDELGAAFEKNDADFNLIYSNDDKDEFSWPFIIDSYKDETVIRPSNKNVAGSYAQLLTTVSLKAGQVLAFDYFTSTESGSDRLYVVVDGHDIYSISGVGTAWETCYAYVAAKDGEYDVALIYMKDGTNDEGDDTVYMKDLRIVSAADIDSASYIYREAATNPNEVGIYEDYVQIFLGNDGYYHVGSETGPLLLADLLGYTLLKPDKYVYELSIGQSYEKAMERFSSYASNSNIFGFVPVTPELKDLLKQFTDDFGYQVSGDKYDENEWLLLCSYYDAYGTDGKQLADPIKGLATFSAYETVLGGETPGADVPLDKAFPNSVYYDRVIMPRGLLFAFTPAVSGTYKVTSFTTQDINAWIFRESDVEARSEWLVYDNVTREIAVKDMNCYMMAYLEAGTTYYIDIAFYDVYAVGEIRFRVDMVGGEGYHRFTSASPGYFTFEQSPSGGIGKILSGGIDVELKDGYWREKRTDGRLGSILYADFTQITNIFDKPIYNNGVSEFVDLLDAHAFDFRRTEDDQYVLNFIDKHYKNGATKEQAVAAAKEEMKAMWGSSYDGYQETYKINEVCDMFIAGTGMYHGTGEDLTEEIRGYIADKLIKVGSSVTVVNAAGTGTETVVIQENDPMIGCIAVDARLAEILQLLMDKYTFVQLDAELSDVEHDVKVYESVENSWRKLCYYRQYFCAATPK